MQNFIHEAAPELLLNKIAELNSILSKHKAKSASAEQLSFYDSLVRVMMFSYRYMREIEYILEENKVLQDQNGFLRHRNSELQSRVDEIDTIARLQCEGRLEDVIKEAEQYTNKVLQVRQLNAQTSEQ